MSLALTWTDLSGKQTSVLDTRPGFTDRAGSEMFSTSSKVTDITHNISLSSSLKIRGRQSPAHRPNPAREFRPFGPRRLVSFNIKFGPENVPNDERLFSRWAWFSHTLIVNADRLSYTHWHWLTPFTLDPSVISLVKLRHFGEVGKIA